MLNLVGPGMLAMIHPLTPAVPLPEKEGDAPAGLFDVVTLVNRRPHPDQALIARHPNISERLFDFKGIGRL